MDGFPSYQSPVYVMPIPEGKGVVLGWPWLDEVNPDVNWTEHTITARGDPHSQNSFRQYIPQAAAQRVAGQRCPYSHYRNVTGDDDVLERFYMHQDYVSGFVGLRVSCRENG
ncbi:hypothetical protein PI125_g762 [Phytophthora idaei]|nr:hypothetical protein PI125_g762 [Phytophthora idaei]